MSSGSTESSKETYVVTARYKDFDYDLEAGLYHYQRLGGGVNTIWTFGGNYNFSNFGVGAMYLGSSTKDAKGNSGGYVFSFNYGDLKSWRKGTYDVFAKYYNQPEGTYIWHGMNGMAGQRFGSMQGFRGYGVGMHYTLAANLVGSLQYFDLSDKIVGDKAKTLWGELTYYF